MITKHYLLVPKRIEILALVDTVIWIHPKFEISLIILKIGEFGCIHFKG